MALFRCGSDTSLVKEMFSGFTPIGGGAMAYTTYDGNTVVNDQIGTPTASSDFNPFVTCEYNSGTYNWTITVKKECHLFIRLLNSTTPVCNEIKPVGYTYTYSRDTAGCLINAYV